MSGCSSRQRAFSECRRRPWAGRTCRRSAKSKPNHHDRGNMDRVLTTHTGSLIRPRALAESMTAGPPATRRHGSSATGDRGRGAQAVRQQVEVGLDVINDGEMGKSNWISYLYERIDGIEFRPIVRERSTSNLPPSRDRQAFPGFYGEHDAAIDRARREAAAARGEGEERAATPGSAPARSATTRPQSSTTSRTSARRSHRPTSSTRFSRWSHPRAPTGSSTSTTRARRNSSSRSPTSSPRSTATSSTRASCSRSTTPC